MPNLEELCSTASLQLPLNEMFRGRVFSDRRRTNLRRVLVRVIDQTIREYQLSYDEFHRYLGPAPEITVEREPEPPPVPGVVTIRASVHIHIGPLLRASGHLETCLGLLWRAIQLLRKLRTCRIEVPSMAVLSTKARDDIDRIRNALQHLDEDIYGEQLPDNAPLAPIVKSDALEFAGVEIPYVTLAHWIAELRDFAATLINRAD